MKFLRNFKLEFGLPNTLIEVIPPKDVSISVVRSIQPEVPNTANIVVYNLEKNHRNVLYRDWYDSTTPYTCKVWGGYTEDLPPLFIGDIRTAYSIKKGPDWETHLTGWDGKYSEHSVLKSYSKKATYDNVLESTLGRIYNPIKGKGGGGLPIKRGFVLHGTSESILALYGSNLYVYDNEKMNTVDDFYAQTPPLRVGDPHTLLVPPIRTKDLVTLTTVLQSEAILGGKCIIEGDAKEFNGEGYIIARIEHNVSVFYTKKTNVATTTLTLYTLK